ncbi:MAG: PAS domain S-box protein [Promethearchaeota archaeon]
MKIIILSYFHERYGPKILLKSPESLNEGEFHHLPALMDLYNEGFFIHTFGGYKSANYIFNIPNEDARGSIELLLISIIFDINSNINNDLSKELLEGFEKEIQNIKDVYKAFYVETKKYEDAAEKFDKIRNLFFTFCSSIPEESIVYKSEDTKILIFGLTNAGKTTLVNYLKNNMATKTLPTTYMDISRIVINNLSMFAYDTPGQEKFRSLWKHYLKNQDGLVFVLNIADKEVYGAARDLLLKIINLPQMEGLPLLILFNKIDLEEPNLDLLKNEINVSEIKNRPIEYFLTCGLTGENVTKAFEWLSIKLSERIFLAPKSDLGIIFSKWDEIEGAKIVAIHPIDIFDDPEIIAIRCFSISQFIFGGEKFKRISVILPFTHLKIKAAVYFDVIPDDKIRGGILPLSLVIFYNERIPRAIIDQFNSYIFESFAQIKEIYTNKFRVLEELKKIHNTILNKLKSVEPTIQALRIAEMRYQALFMAARDAILIIDRKSGIIVDANTQAERLLNQLPEEIIGMHSTQLKLEGEEDFKNIIFKQIELENPKLIEVRIKDSNEGSIPIEINASEIQMGGQNLIQCILRDITERKLAEKKLRDSENKYRHLFKHSPFSIILIDSNRIVVDCNPAIKQLLGYNKEELVNKRYDSLSFIHPKYLKSILESLRDLIKGEPITILDVQLITKTGAFLWANLQLSEVMIGGKMYFQIIANNITEQKEAEAALRESEAQFHIAYDRANFYKELFAHEVNNVFKNIQSFIMDYTKKLIPTKKNKRLYNLLEDIKEQNQSGAKLVYIVQKLAEIESKPLALTKMDLYTILGEAIKNVYELFQYKKVNITIYPPNEKFYVLANEILVDVFENVLLNIIEYNKNPEIEIEVIIYRQLKDEINYLKMEFVDKAIEISQDFKEEIALNEEKNYKTFKSMLLGLSFVDQIISSLKGEIWVTGSNFLIIIPEAL